jgi:CubicO group peptidase (beta-lactamase class C family)
MVVVRNGYLVFEWYRQGSGPDDPQNVASVTKSVVSALVGIAIDAGALRGVDARVLDFFPEYEADASDAGKRALTLRHLLTMTAPVGWQTGPWGMEPLDRLRRQRDWVRFSLDLLGRGGEPGRFQYSAVCAHLVSAILTRATGKSAREYANERLFRLLGMTEIPDREMTSFTRDDVFGTNVSGWIKDPSGITAGGWGLTMTARDMARLGFLYLNRGSWAGRQVIPAGWIAESTARNANDYGYYWWLRGSGLDASYSAAGSGGNLVFCAPAHDLVVAITAKVAIQSHDPWLPVEQYVLPAIV